jgi:hypothetical protein
VKAIALVVILAGALSGAVAGVLAGTLLRPAQSAPRVVAEEGLQVAALERRLDALGQANRDLAERLRMLEDRPVIAPPVREVVVAAPAPEEVEREQEREALAAVRDPGGAPPENFRQSVDDALRSLREQEQREREAQRRERYEQRLDEQLAELSLELGLTQYQSGELRKVMLDINGRRDAIVNAARDQGDWVSVRDQMRELRTQTETALGQVLNPNQYEQFMSGTGNALLRGGGFPGGGDDRRGPDRRRDRPDEG